MRRRTLIATLAATALAGACSRAGETTTPPSAPPASQEPFTPPASGDWQTGPPESGVPTQGPIPSATVEPPASTLPPGKAGVPRGQNTPDKRVKRRNADAVARAFAERLVTVDTRLDNRPNDASRRAAVFATPKLAKSLTRGAPIGGVGQDFLILQQHNGWTTVTSTLGGLGQPPPDTTTTAIRAVTTTTIGTNDSGWKGEPQTLTWGLELTRTNKKADWHVSTFQAIT